MKHTPIKPVGPIRALDRVSGWCPKSELKPEKVRALNRWRKELMQLPINELAAQYRRLGRVDVGRASKTTMAAAIIRASTSREDLYYGGWEV